MGPEFKALSPEDYQLKAVEPAEEKPFPEDLLPELTGPSAPTISEGELYGRIQKSKQ